MMSSQATIPRPTEQLALPGWRLAASGDRTCVLRGVPAVTASRDPASAFLHMREGAAVMPTR